eukprot:COSAG06_NODE_34822_length_468_cov_5.111111_1_plen_38_part_10
METKCRVLWTRRTKTMPLPKDLAVDLDSIGPIDSIERR